MFLICRRKKTLKGSKSMTARTPIARSNSGKTQQEQLTFKSQFSGSVIMKIIDVSETSDCQRCVSFMIQTKDRGKLKIKKKEHFPDIRIIKCLGVALMTFQVKSSEIKRDVISTAADVVTKLKMGDKDFAADLVTKVEHNQLNVTTKVI